MNLRRKIAFRMFCSRYSVELTPQERDKASARVCNLESLKYHKVDCWAREEMVATKTDGLHF